MLVKASTGGVTLHSESLSIKLLALLSILLFSISFYSVRLFYYERSAHLSRAAVKAQSGPRPCSHTRSQQPSRAQSSCLPAGSLTALAFDRQRVESELPVDHGSAGRLYCGQCRNAHSRTRPCTTRIDRRFDCFRQADCRR
jgi:hypothetical protein